MPVCDSDSASQRQLCDCGLVDKESQVWLNNESCKIITLLTYSEQRLTRSIKYSASSSVVRSEFAMATERLHVFKLATDKLVYVTKIWEEIVVVIANTSELNTRIELTPNRSVALFFRFTRNMSRYCQVSQLTHIDVKVSALHRNLVGYD